MKYCGAGWLVGSVALRDPNVGEVLPGELQMTFDVLADNGLFVSASHVVPFDTVAVEVVEDGQASLFLASFAAFAVIRLAHSTPAEERTKSTFKICGSKK